MRNYAGLSHGLKRCQMLNKPVFAEGQVYACLMLKKNSEPVMKTISHLLQRKRICDFNK
jgi:hypothetical protein